MADHALLSPSGASRWLACPPSARFELNFEDTSSQAADEGTLAHSLGETLLREALKMVSPKKAKADIAAIKKHPLYQAEMLTYMKDYKDFCLEVYSTRIAEYNNALGFEGMAPAMFIEEKLDLSSYAPECFGTGDVIIVSEGVLDFIDLKYGKGVEVSAIENNQLMLYGLGAYRKHRHEYDIEVVNMTIYQPRIKNFSSWSITIKELLAWARTELKPKAELAFAGEGEFNPGPKQCKFCKGKANCRALAEYNLDLLKHDFKIDNYIDEDGIIEALTKGPLLVDWVTAIKKYALDQAVKGKKYKGFKLVDGRSDRKFTSEKKVAAILRLIKGFEDDEIYNKKLKGIGEFEKLLGADGIYQTLGRYIIKPPGAPTLVPDDDKREVRNSAKSLFKHLES